MPNDVLFETILRGIDSLGRVLTKERRYLLFVGAGKIQVERTVFDTQGSLYYIVGEENLLILARSYVFLAVVPQNCSWFPQDVPVLAAATPMRDPVKMTFYVVVVLNGAEKGMTMEDALINYPDEFVHTFTEQSLGLSIDNGQLAKEFEVKQLFLDAIKTWQDNNGKLPKHPRQVIRASTEHPHLYDKYSIERRFRELEDKLGAVLLAIYMTYVTKKQITKDDREKICSLNDKQLKRIITSLRLLDALQARLNGLQEDINSDAQAEIDPEEDPPPHHHLPRMAQQNKSSKLPPMIPPVDLESSTRQRWVPLPVPLDRNESYEEEPQ